MTPEEVIIIARLAEVRGYIAGSQAVTEANVEMGLSAEKAGLRFTQMTKRGFLMNQFVFTARRLLYGFSLGLFAAGAGALKLGWDYNSAMQTASVALKNFFPTQQALNDELDRLFTIAKYTPFNLKDVTLAFRNMFPALQYLGFSAERTNKVILALTNGLSVSGKVTPASLNRVSIALQHMAYQGKLTGISVNQLARDGIPIFRILRQELGLSADQMHRVGQLGIPANVAIQAIQHFMLTTPGYAGAAMRQSLLTFHGLFTTFQDSISRVMGTLEKGVFLRLQNRLARIVTFFGRVDDQTKRNGGSLKALINAINNELTPGTNRVVKVWGLFSGSLRATTNAIINLFNDIKSNKLIMGLLYGALWALYLVTKSLEWATKHLGAALYPLIGLWVVYKTVTKAAAFWTAVQALEEKILKTQTKDLTFWQFTAVVAQNAYYFATKAAVLITIIWNKTVIRAIKAWKEWAFATTMARSSLGTFTGKVFVAEGVLATFSRFLWRTVIPALTAFWLEFWPVILVAAAIAGLVLLYFKWKWFHDLVNRTVTWFLKYWPYVVAALVMTGNPIALLIAGAIVLAKYWKEIAKWVKIAATYLNHPFAVPGVTGKNFGPAAGQLVNPGGDVSGSRHHGMFWKFIHARTGWGWWDWQGSVSDWLNRSQGKPKDSRNFLNQGWSGMGGPGGGTMPTFNQPESWMTNPGAPGPMKGDVILDKKKVGDVIWQEYQKAQSRR